MANEKLQTLFGKLKDDPGFREEFKGAADLDAALAIAKKAGFDISKADLLKYQAQQTLELSDEDLEMVAGGGMAGKIVDKMEDRLMPVVDKVIDSGFNGLKKMPLIGGWF